MKIKISDKEYNFELTGTIGLLYMAERLLGEKFDMENNFHLMMLYYSCLTASNPGKKVPDTMEFMSHTTTTLFNEISTYFWAEWRRLEGLEDIEEGKEKEPEKGED